MYMIIGLLLITKKVRVQKTQIPNYIPSWIKEVLGSVEYLTLPNGLIRE